MPKKNIRRSRLQMAKENGMLSNSLGSIHSLLFKSDFESDDDAPVFVAIDFEGTNDILANFKHPHRGTQLGISIFDTKHLDPRYSKIQSFHCITTGTILSGDQNYSAKYGCKKLVERWWSSPGTQCYATKAAEAFRFGTSKLIEESDMYSSIQDCLKEFRNRPIVLVGHGMSRDLEVLLSFGFFDDPNTNIVAKLDTNTLAQKLKTNRRTSLWHVLQNLGIPDFAQLHNAGNDANYTLRAVLLLGLRTAAAPTPQSWQGFTIRTKSEMICFISIKDMMDRRTKRKICRRYADRTYSVVQEMSDNTIRKRFDEAEFVMPWTERTERQADDGSQRITVEQALGEQSLDEVYPFRTERSIELLDGEEDIITSGSSSCLSPKTN